jgi:hypothetical protein
MVGDPGDDIIKPLRRVDVIFETGAKEGVKHGPLLAPSSYPSGEPHIVCPVNLPYLCPACMQTVRCNHN